MNSLFNLPPGCLPSDIDDKPEKQCISCGHLFEPEENENICSKCQYYTDKEDDDT